MKSFIIHLKRAHERKPQVLKLQKSLAMASEIIDAVDARQLSDYKLENVYCPNLFKPNYPFTLSNAEIACFLSHRRAWQNIVDQNLPGAFIFEDDVELTSDFTSIITEISSFINLDTYLRFPFRSREHGKTIWQKGQFKIILPIPCGLGQIGQYIGRNAAQQLINMSVKIDRPVDVFAQMFWLTNVQPLAFFPVSVSEISKQLGGSLIQKKPSRWKKIKREIQRPIYRGQIFWLSKLRSL